MNKVIKLLMLSLALATGLGIQNNMLYAAKSARFTSPAEGLRAPESLRRAAKKLWFWAVENRHLTVVEKLIKLGFDVDFQNEENGYTALMIAAVAGDVDMIRLLIKAGANLNIQNTNGATALITAVIYNQINVVRLLISVGANLNIRNADGNTALIVAAACVYCRDAFRLLVEAKADIDVQNSIYGDTALMMTARGGDVDEMRLLIEAGATLDIQDFAGCTALIDAAKAIRYEAACLLADASLSKHMQRVSWLAKEVPQLPLEVCQHGIAPFVNPINIQDNDGHDACWHVENLMNLTPAQKTVLLKKLKPEQHDFHAHKSPLVLALEAGDYGTARYLIEKRAALSPEQNNGYNIRQLILQSDKFTTYLKVCLLESISLFQPPVRNPHSVCEICRDNNDGESIFFEPCGHCVHKTCAQNYLSFLPTRRFDERTCPTCNVLIRNVSAQDLPAEEDEKKDA